MLPSGTSVVLWIYDDAARLFLGIERPKEDVSRWAIIGKVDREQAGVGIWLAIDQLQERRGAKVTNTWTVRPPVCLIRWNSIITAQLLGDDPADMRNIGFQPPTE
jgi:hypothetical protein